MIISAIELKKRMEAQPFKPFRICITDGKTYDITNYDAMFVKRNCVEIGIDLDPHSLAEHFVECAIIHITRVEDIATPKAA
jgi:hypothetical protein